MAPRTDYGKRNSALLLRGTRTRVRPYDFIRDEYPYARLGARSSGGWVRFLERSDPATFLLPRFLAEW